MEPTDVALDLLNVAANVLKEADVLFGRSRRSGEFDLLQSTSTFRIAAGGYLDPNFLPAVVAAVKRAAPFVRLELLRLADEFDYRRGLADGKVDLVIGNWLRPPEELHLGRLIVDEVVCLVRAGHPALRAGPSGWTAGCYLASEHVAPTPLHAGRPGVIDEYLAEVGLTRSVTVRTPHFGLIPSMVARSLLVLTTGRRFCDRYLRSMPLEIVPCPIAFPPMDYYQLWHARTHHSSGGIWLRSLVRGAASQNCGDEQR